MQDSFVLGIITTALGNRVTLNSVMLPTPPSNNELHPEGTPWGDIVANSVDHQWSQLWTTESGVNLIDSAVPALNQLWNDSYSEYLPDKTGHVMTDNPFVSWFTDQAVEQYRLTEYPLPTQRDATFLIDTSGRVSVMWSGECLYAFKEEPAWGRLFNQKFAEVNKSQVPGYFETSFFDPEMVGGKLTIEDGVEDTYNPGLCLGIDFGKYSDSYSWRTDHWLKWLQGNYSNPGTVSFVAAFLAEFTGRWDLADSLESYING